MNPPSEPKPRRRTLRVASLVVIGLVLTYALAGFVLAPWLAMRQLPQVAAEQLQRRAHVGKIAFNPFTLVLRVSEFALEEQDGRPMLSFKEATVNLEWRSLARRGWVLSELRLTEPAIHVEIAQDGRLNLAALGGKPGEPADRSEPARFAVGHLAIENGRIDFVDQREGYRNRLERLSLELSSVSTLDAKNGPYALTAQTPDGAKLRWNGELSLQPLAASGVLALDHSILPQLNPYLDDQVAARITSGRADLELPYRFAIADGKPQLEVRGAKILLQDLALAARDTDKPFAKFGRVALEGIMIDLQARRASAEVLRIADFALAATRDEKGALDLAQLFPGGSKDEAKPAAWQASLATAEFTNGSVSFDDRVIGQTLKLEQVGAKLTEVSSDTAKPLAFELAAATGTGGRITLNGRATPQSGALEARVEASGVPLALLQPLLAEHANLKLVSGELSLAGDLRAGGEGPRLEIHGASILLQELALAARGTDTPFAKFGRLALEGVMVDLQARRAFAEALRVADFALTANRNGKGELDLAQLFPHGSKDDAKPAAWQASLATAEFTNGSVSFDDRVIGQTLKLAQVRAKLTEVSSDTAKPLTFELAAALADGGRISLNGRATPQSGALEARVEASGVPLALLQPLLAEYANLKLVSGELSLKGEVRAGGKGPKFAYTGAAAASNVAIDDAGNARLLAWKSLSTGSLRASLKPDRAEIDELRWSAPAGKLAIATDGTTNISRAFGHRKDETAAPAGTAATDEKKADEEGGFAVTVRRVRVEQGRLEFSDESLTPGFTARIHELTGTVNGVSTDRATRSQIALEGRVDEFGYARVTGNLNAFAPSDRTNFRVQFRNLDVTAVSPYTVKFAGYRIASGRLSLDLNYRVQNKLLEGDNKIVLEQFTLGERVESPNALKLPLELAVALLKDSNGVIDIAVPISGNLDDPQFDYGALIWKAIGNLVTSIVTAPFRALGRLFGGGEDEELGTIAFDPGSSRLLPPEREKLKRIVEALAKRPELKLVIPARYDTQADGRALRRGALRRELAKRAGFDVADEDPPGPVSIEDQRTRNALRELFAERFSQDELDKLKAEAEAKAGAARAESGKPQQDISVLERLRKFARGEPQVADATDFYRTLARRLVEAQPLPDGALDDLAQKRGAAVVAALKEAGVDAGRVSQSKAEPTTDAAAKQVKLQLSLAPMQ
ncbi:MAG: DUF748 domain-containing protein [Betaproteobacteria bacterium]|nr:DUF748 domain-containing protein [Betaproteobacteria bacterium]